MISTKMATLYELQTVYSVEDVHLLLEIVVIDAHNRRLLTPKAK